MGIVHHSNYFAWFEIGRAEHLQKSGMSYADAEKQGFMVPLVQAECKYKLPAKYPDKLMVYTKIDELKMSRVRYSYRVMRGDELIATGYTLHAFTDTQIRPVNLKKAAPDFYAIMESLAKE